jgi:hypothetical protein
METIVAVPSSLHLAIRACIMLAGLPVYYFWKKLLTQETRK